MKVRRKRLGGTATNQITGGANHQLTALYELVGLWTHPEDCVCGAAAIFHEYLFLKEVAAVILFTAANIFIYLPGEEKLFA